MSTMHGIAGGWAWGLVGVMLVGCAPAGESGESAPGADTELETHATLVNGDWTATAITPSGTDGSTLSAQATFDGPAGYFRRMGVCYLQLTNTACTSVSNCGSISIPTGGSRYCIQPDGASSSVCAFRPGTQADYCAGSPAMGGTMVAAGTYVTPPHTPLANTGYVSDACFEGCTSSDPSVSSSSTCVSFRGQLTCPY